ncbi:MAG TPA: hypothetical protein VMF89_36875 [Polyangiales bacterium]|nr:hypothetical protein [Polyangiales bacterium]
MSWPAVLGCLLLAACEPVLLVADRDEPRGAGAQVMPSMAAADGGSGSAHHVDAGTAAPSASGSAAPIQTAAGNENDDKPLEVQLTVKAVDCGSCFDLSASPKGGVPPFLYEWDDGSNSPNRRVCVGSIDLNVWVIVEDGTGARSNAHSALLQTDNGDVSPCGPSTQKEQMCLMNPSFEGTAALNTGTVFDAVPWSACIDSSTDTVSNTPDVASNGLDWTTMVAPLPVDGDTYLALSTAEQASQQICEPLTARSTTKLRLDAMRLDLGGGEMFLQIWGGVSSNCSQRQLLWVSPALSTTNWETYCATLEPREFMDLITLRAETPMPTLAASFMLVDNLTPVDECP